MTVQSEDKRSASPARGQAWKRRGDKIIFRIMAVADGYVMARYKGCAPFILFVKDMQRNCIRMDAFDADLGRPS